MSLTSDVLAPLKHVDRFFIGGEWVQPSSSAMIDVINPGTEQVFFSIAEAQEPDMTRAVGAARKAFDDGPWTRLSHAERAEYLRALAAGLRGRSDDLGQIWPRESGVLHSIARYSAEGAAATFEYYAGLFPSFSSGTPGLTRSPSPGRPPPAGGSHPYAASGSLG